VSYALQCRLTSRKARVLQPWVFFNLYLFKEAGRAPSAPLLATPFFRVPRKATLPFLECHTGRGKGEAEAKKGARGGPCFAWRARRARRARRDKNKIRKARQRSEDIVAKGEC